MLLFVGIYVCSVSRGVWLGVVIVVALVVVVVVPLVVVEEYCRQLGYSVGE